MEEQQVAISQQPTPTPSKKFPWKKLILFLVAFLIVVGGVGSVLAWKTTYLDNYLPASVKEFFGRGEKPEEEPEEKPEEESETKPEEDKTKDWKTYIDPTLGFTIKYPPNWSAERGPSSALPGYGYDSVGFLPPETTAGGIGFYVVLRGINKPADQSLKDYVEGWMKINLGEGWEEQFLPVGFEAEWREVKYGDLSWDELTDMYKTKWLFSFNRSKVYNVQYSLSLDLDQVELMLSGFKFL